MVTEDLPILGPGATMREAVVQLAERRGIAIVTDDAGTPLGVITTGDLTRLMERESNPFPVPVAWVMTRSPKTTRVDELGSAAVQRMQRHRWAMALPVIDQTEQVVGIVHLHDLLRAGCGSPRVSGGLPSWALPPATADPGSRLGRTTHWPIRRTRSCGLPVSSYGRRREQGGSPRRHGVFLRREHAGRDARRVNTVFFTETGQERGADVAAGDI